MQKSYIVEGMTCNGCVNTVKNKLESLSDVSKVTVQLEHPQVVLESSNNIETKILNEAIGKYELSDIQNIIEKDIPEVSITTYRPLIIIVLFITGVSLLAQYPFDNFSSSLWMRHFMAGFFLVFSFFKLINLSGFADSYAMYDLIAERWKTWGFIYPFIELALGIMYLINFNPTVTNILTLVILGSGTIGVVKSNLDKRKIKCACLGDVFNLPMSTVTIIENVTMLIMATYMLM